MKARRIADFAPIMEGGFSEARMTDGTPPPKTLEMDAPTTARGSTFFLTGLYCMRGRRMAWGKEIAGRKGADFDIVRERLKRRRARLSSRGDFQEIYQIPALGIRGVHFDWILFDGGAPCSADPDDYRWWEDDEAAFLQECEVDHDEDDFDSPWEDAAVGGSACLSITESLIGSESNSLLDKFWVLPAGEAPVLESPSKNKISTRWSAGHAWREAPGTTLGSGAIRYLVKKFNRTVDSLEDEAIWLIDDLCSDPAFHGWILRDQVGQGLDFDNYSYCHWGAMARVELLKRSGVGFPPSNLRSSSSLRRLRHVEQEFLDSD